MCASPTTKKGEEQLGYLSSEDDVPNAEGRVVAHRGEDALPWVSGQAPELPRRVARHERGRQWGRLSVLAQRPAHWRRVGRAGPLPLLFLLLWANLVARASPLFRAPAEASSSGTGSTAAAGPCEPGATPRVALEKSENS